MSKLASFGVLILLFLAAPAASQVDDRLIVPGQRIGKWTLEMTIDELIRINGPRRAGPGGGALIARQTDPRIQADVWVHRWDHLGLRAWTIGRDVQKISVLASITDEFKTAKGISAVSTREEVEAAYGKPSTVLQERPWIGVYDEIGMSAAPGTGIRIFPPGTAKTIWR